eukprot:TRINITY_DN7893_c3_g1_i1.p3 TRINITY_DN7893_c3_g1~~TRINITY_DN7893_c3_g1_i1.p3  ORF type:complete len:518 (+),score=53.26 TRINITY_DN7893_c3_g1_i1:1381-2934(+)
METQALLPPVINFVSKKLAELVLAVLWMVFGAGAFSFTIGNLSSVLANFDSQASKLTLKMAQLNEFCKDAKIGKKLREELKASIEYTTQKGMFSWIDKQKIFAELPPQIKSEVAKQMYGGMINKVRFFKSKDSTFISLVVPLLQPYKVAKKERVYTKDDHPTASKIPDSNKIIVYFLIEGKIVYVYNDRIPFKEMVKGSYFGEGDILFQRKRMHTARALVDSHTLTLSKQVFESLVVPEYPEVIEEMRKVARERDRRFFEAEQLMRKYVSEKAADIETIFDDSDNEGRKRRRRPRRIFPKRNKDDQSEFYERSEIGSKSDAYSKSEANFSLDNSAKDTPITNPHSKGFGLPPTESILNEESKKANDKEKGLQSTAIENQTIAKPKIGSPRNHLPSSVKCLPPQDDPRMLSRPLFEDMKGAEDAEKSESEDGSDGESTSDIKVKLASMRKEIKEGNLKQKVLFCNRKKIGVPDEIGQNDVAARRYAQDNEYSVWKQGKVGTIRVCSRLNYLYLYKLIT